MVSETEAHAYARKYFEVPDDKTMVEVTGRLFKADDVWELMKGFANKAVEDDRERTSEAMKAMFKELRED